MSASGLYGTAPAGRSVRAIASLAVSSPAGSGLAKSRGTAEVATPSASL